MALSREMLQRRLRDVDFRIVQEMQCPTMQATAHRSRNDAHHGMNPITLPAQAHESLFYRVAYRIKTLLGPNTYSDPARQPILILVDLNKHGRYPFTAPESFVIGPTTPWSPHFSTGLPVCFERPGRVWAPDGSKTLGSLLLHLARLINFDETIDDLNYAGYNPQAVQFWRRTLNSGPITPKLQYPMLPTFVYGQQPPAPPQKSRASVVEPGQRAVIRPGTGKPTSGPQ
jgi:hypothetical protein